MPGALTWDPTPAGGALSTARGAPNPTADGSALNAAEVAGVRALVSGAWIAPEPPQIAPEDYAIQPATLRALVLPNVYPAQPLHVVHPSLLVSPENFGGYRYWLAFTPYPSTQPAFENPCVVASQDLINWVQPAPNPITEQPAPAGGTNYNADTHLFMGPDRSTLYLAYRERVIGAQNRVMIRSTTDGRTWTPAVPIIGGTQGSQDFASMSIWWNGTGWTMLSHNIDASAPWPVQRTVSATADLFGAWGSPSAATIAPLAGRGWWHSSASRLSSGQVVALLHDNGLSAGAAGNLFFATSGDDGATWQVSAPVSFSGGSRYRSCFAMQGDTMHMLTGNGLTGIDYVRAERGRLQLLSDVRGQLAGQLSAATIPGNALWADTCIRADNATVPGTASSGGSYTVSSGTWGIASNQLYPVASGRLLASVGTANHRVQAQFSNVTAAVQQWLIGRAVDGSNYWRCGIQTPAASGVQIIGLQSVIGGSVTDYPGVARCQIGDYIGLDFSGSRIQVLVNGQPVYEMQNATFSTTGTSIGLQANLGATTRYRNLVAVAN